MAAMLCLLESCSLRIAPRRLLIALDDIQDLDAASWRFISAIGVNAPKNIMVEA